MIKNEIRNRIEILSNTVEDLRLLVNALERDRGGAKEPEPVRPQMDWDTFEYHMENCKTLPFNKVFQEHEKEAVGFIVDAFLDEGYTDIRLLAYALATARIETGSNMRPVRETFASTDAQARKKIKELRQRYLTTGRGPKYEYAKEYTAPDGSTHMFYGRGLVQLTWYTGYQKEGIEWNPDKALEPDFAAKLLFKGLLDGRWNGRGKGLMYYLDKNDIVSARRTVNVLNKAELVADYYKDFLLALSKSLPALT